MRTINQIESLVNANRISEREAIEYIVDNYGNEEYNMNRFPVNEEYCAVESSNRGQSVNFGDYTCSGDIVDWSYWRENFYRICKENEDGELEFKIYHTNIYMFVDGEIIIMRLYDVLKESDF